MPLVDFAANDVAAGCLHMPNRRSHRILERLGLAVEGGIWRATVLPGRAIICSGSMQGIGSLEEIAGIRSEPKRKFKGFFSHGKHSLSRILECRLRFTNLHVRTTLHELEYIPGMSLWVAWR